MSLLGESICYSVSRFLLTRDLLGRSHEVAGVSDKQGEFEVWREECIQRSMTAFAYIPLAGKTVLDFGCGGGRLGPSVRIP